MVELLAGGEGVLVLDNCEHLRAPARSSPADLLERQPYLRFWPRAGNRWRSWARRCAGWARSTCRRPTPIPFAPANRPRCGCSSTGRQPYGPASHWTPTQPVVDIVRRLDGLPLALELAAARLRTMGADQIARRLDDRFRLLSTGNRTAQPRQQTLHAVIEWSWDLLTDQERTLARRMSIFPARTGIAAIEAVCSDETLPPGEVIYLLDSLVDKSIVERAGDGYRMLETIRAHAAEKLRPRGGDKDVLHRLTRHFADLAEEHEPLLRSDEQVESLRLFEAEYDNLMYALQTAIDGQRRRRPRPGSSARCTGTGSCSATTRRAEAFVARVLEFGEALPADARAAFTAIHLVGGEGGPITTPSGCAPSSRTARARARCERYPMLLTMALLMAVDTRAGRAGRTRDRPGAERLGLAGRSPAPS